MERLLPKEFYLSTDVVQLSKELLGKKLVSHIGGVTTSGYIVETEAYEAPDDLASHAKGFKRTPRNETMYTEGGHSYVYICYGIHPLFNVVTGPQDLPHAVLIRAIEPIYGLDTMMKRRNMKTPKKEMMNGPGKFTRAMSISKEHDHLLLYDPHSPIQIYDSDYQVNEIISGPRVGMSHHTGASGHWPYRFRVGGNKWTSKPDVVEYGW